MSGETRNQGVQVCSWCGVAGEAEPEPQPLTEVKLDLTPGAIELICSKYSDDVICKRCYAAFLRGFNLGEKYSQKPETA
jgi:hypothetical protein